MAELNLYNGSGLRAQGSGETAHSNNLKKLSVIIPAYNAAKFLVKCVDSIANQTYQNIEIVIVNNGSQDNTPELCYELEAKYNSREFKIVNLNPNQGINYARCAGVENASGEYIAFIDSDDYLEPETYETAIKILEKNNCDIVHFSTKLVDLNGEIISKWARQDMTFNNKQDIYEYFLTDPVLTWTVWDKVYKRSLFEDITWPKISAFEDYCVAAQIFAKANKLITIDKFFYNYVQRSDSTSRFNTIGKSKHDEIITSLELVTNLTQNKLPDFLPEVMAKNLELIIAVLSTYILSNYSDKREVIQRFAKICQYDYKLMKAELIRQDRELKLKLRCNQKIHFWLLTHFPNVYQVYLRTRIKLHTLTGI